MHRIARIVSLSFLFAGAAYGQQVCPCVPVAYEWVSSACDSWDCAVSAFVLSNGDKNVIVFPTKNIDFPWVVLRRVATGSAVVSPDAPYKVDGFDSMKPATDFFGGVDPVLHPMLLSVPDGRVLVVARTTGDKRHRAIGAH